jgi:hypothetical protein
MRQLFTPIAPNSALLLRLSPTRRRNTANMTLTLLRFFTTRADHLVESALVLA